MANNNTLTVFGAIPSAIEFINEMGNSIASSKLAGCENKDQGKFMAMTCLARRCDPLYLAERYDIIKGRLRLKSVIMLAKFRGIGGKHRIVERTADAAEIELSFENQTHRFRLSWQEATEEDFTSGKDGDVKDNYATPRKRMQMLWYRVVSDGVSVVAPEVLLDDNHPAEFPSSGEGSAVVPDVETVAPSSSSSEKLVAPVDADDSGEAIDAEYTVAKAADPVVDDRVEIDVNGPATEAQREQVIGLLRQLYQSGQTDINDRVKAKLASHNIDGILGLTVKEADALIEALKVKEIQLWVDQALVGHSAK